ncbi:MAG: nucleotide exchange factor GrpE [Clostridia bacterium]|nr:nucleotide exchange factor GrpE [Clostridia bacterium]
MEEEKTTPAAEETAAEEPTAPAEEPTLDKKGERKLLRELSALEKKLGEAQKENLELSDKHLRLAAEYDNFRRRATAERTAAYTDGLEGALEKLLPILDNLERAALYRDAERVAEGLALTARAAAEAFAALGVEEFGAVGETFDPNLHNAVMHVEDEERGEGEIAEVHQKGYKKGDRILRYAMVTVAN